jgi:hypothetical protein
MKRIIEKRANVSQRLDPRRARGFNPEWYPNADGREAPTYDSSDPHDRIRLQGGGAN